MLKRILGNRKGAVIPLVCGGLVALMGLSALAIDVGNLYTNKARLQNIADTAALAGARQFPDETQVLGYAAESAKLNGKPDDIINNTLPANNTITVLAKRTVQNYFASVLGLSFTEVSARSTAKSGYASAVSGCTPWGVVQGDFVYDVSYTMKYGAGDGYSGNYGALALGGTGAAVYLENIMYGYDGTLSVGQTVPTETGNMVGPTKKGVNYLFEQGIKIITVPIIDSIAKNGRSEVTIVGFAAFEIEQVSGQGLVTGKFKKMVKPGELSDSGLGYGLKTVKLIQ